MRKVRSLIQTHYFWQESVPIGEELPLFTGCLEKLFEKGLERGFDHRFGQYTNAKTARKVPFRCPVRLRVAGASETFRTVSLRLFAKSLEECRESPRVAKTGLLVRFSGVRNHGLPVKGLVSTIFQTVSLGNPVNTGCTPPPLASLLPN